MLATAYLLLPKDIQPDHNRFKQAVLHVLIHTDRLTACLDPFIHLLATVSLQERELCREKGPKVIFRHPGLGSDVGREMSFQGAFPGKAERSLDPVLSEVFFSL